MNTKEKAQKIRKAVMRDLLGRGGFDNAWDDCDQDIQKEIEDELDSLIELELNKE